MSRYLHGESGLRFPSSTLILAILFFFLLLGLLFRFSGVDTVAIQVSKYAVLEGAQAKVSESKIQTYVRQ